MEEQALPDPRGRRLPFTISLRVKLFLTGVLFPAFSVAAGLLDVDAGDSPWQSGNQEDYILLFLQSPGVLCFLPAIVFSMLSLSVLVWKPECVRYMWVRIGLYSGAVVSFQFLVALMAVTAFFSPVIAGFVGPGLALIVWGCSSVIQRIHRFTILHLMIATAVTALLLSAVLAIGSNAYELIASPLMFIFIAAPTLNFVTYTRMAVFAMTHELPYPGSRGKVLVLLTSIIAWLAGFWVAWRYAIVRVLDEYQTLPTTNPNCFIASAAAHGSPSLVRSVSIESPNGLVKLNHQMQRLKFLELALQSVSPCIHRMLRSLYNIAGPHVAKLCKTSQPTANVAFLLLKPVEWLAECIRVATGVSRTKVDQIYLRRH